MFSKTLLELVTEPLDSASIGQPERSNGINDGEVLKELVLVK
jgi:hypothetical protein